MARVATPGSPAPAASQGSPVATPLPDEPRGRRKIIDLNNVTVTVSSVKYTPPFRFKRRKLTLIKDVSFHAYEGEILGLIGESGAGKSTILRCITGQMKPSAGTVNVAGVDVVHHKNEAIKRFGYVPQLELISVYDHFSALENVYYFGKMYLSGVSDEQIKQRGREVLGILGFKEALMDKKAKHLSGGEKKRVSIAIGMVHDPEILLLDEPTTGLDISLRIQVLNYLKNLNKKLGISVVIVSHDLEIAQYCSRIVLLEKGRVIEFGDPEVLINKLLPCEGRAIKLEVAELNEEIIESIRALPEVKFVIKTGRNDVKIFAEDIDKVMISKIIEHCENINIPIVSITLDRADFTSYYRIKSKLEKEKQKAINSDPANSP
ncbi:MAG: ABC transporter ATP-binding protein [Candidatus Lokiarchaeota archaeon]|nr:ABC transporter ATP-binding protein [Candidatus Lokiarchaeota archaeon]